MTVLNPAEYVIQVFGGVRKLARAIGRSPSSVCKWRKPRAEDGCAGHIPSVAQRIILEIAKAKDLDITPNDLAYGRKVKRAVKAVIVFLTTLLFGDDRFVPAELAEWFLD